MLNFPNITVKDFLTNYWQKNFLIIPDAIPGFINPVSPDELAGLALEEEIESRMVFQTPGEDLSWSLKRGPFTADIFTKLPPTHWTLLVQGVDRFVPEVASLLDHFNFLPQWRVDDVMISYAVKNGSVGPHYDNYDVFLYQAKGRRKWLLTTIGCTEDNYQEGLDLRIMKEFKTEHEFILEEGDMLYLPPHVAHHGISLSEDCLTYSFGYRSYQGQELWDSFGEYLAANNKQSLLYIDPDWSKINNTSEIPEQAWLQAKKTMQAILSDDRQIKSWFAAFSTSLDSQAESVLPIPDEDEETISVEQFKEELRSSTGIIRNAVCRFAYFCEGDSLKLYINGCNWPIGNADTDFIKDLANKRHLLVNELEIYIDNQANLTLLYDLWLLEWLDLLD